MLGVKQAPRHSRQSTVLASGRQKRRSTLEDPRTAVPFIYSQSSESGVSENERRVLIYLSDPVQRQRRECAHCCGVQVIIAISLFFFTIFLSFYDAIYSEPNVPQPAHRGLESRVAAVMAMGQVDNDPNVLKKNLDENSAYLWNICPAAVIRVRTSISNMTVVATAKKCEVSNTTNIYHQGQRFAVFNYSFYGDDTKDVEPTFLKSSGQLLEVDYLNSRNKDEILYYKVTDETAAAWEQNYLADVQKSINYSIPLVELEVNRNSRKRKLNTRSGQPSFDYGNCYAYTFGWESSETEKLAPVAHHLNATQFEKDTDLDIVYKEQDDLDDTGFRVYEGEPLFCSLKTDNTTFHLAGVRIEQYGKVDNEWYTVYRKVDYSYIADILTMTED